MILKASRVLILQAMFSDSEPTWSPDGSLIAFV